jgi:hypothetical protein
MGFKCSKKPQRLWMQWYEVLGQNTLSTYQKYNLVYGECKQDAENDPF